LLEKVRISKDEAKQIDRANALRLTQADISRRVQFGVASAEERRTQFVQDLNLAIERGVVKEGDRAKAMALYEKTLKETIEAEQVRASSTPQLTQLTLEAADLRKTLDTELSGALRGSTSEFLAMAKGTETLSQGLKNVSARILDAVANALLMRTIVGPLAGGVSGLFGGGIFSGLFGGGAAAPAYGTVGGVGIYNASQFNPIDAMAGVGHSGGMIGQLGTRRFLHPSYFDTAPRFHSGGMIDYAAGERPVIGKIGEEIGWPADLAKKYGAGGNVTVGGTTVVVQGNADKDTLQLMMREFAKRDAALANTIDGRMARRDRIRSLSS
jgi:hypothetical protein